MDGETTEVVNVAPKHLVARGVRIWQIERGSWGLSIGPKRYGNMKSRRDAVTISQEILSFTRWG